MSKFKFNVGDEVVCKKCCGVNSCAEPFDGVGVIDEFWEDIGNRWYTVEDGIFSYLEEDIELAKKDGKAEESTEVEDVVNHPKHYTNRYKECIDEFEMIYGTRWTLIACIFNVHKYRFRAASKNGQIDTDKSDWYGAKIEELSNKIGTDKEILGAVSVDDYARS